MLILSIFSFSIHCDNLLAFFAATEGLKNSSYKTNQVSHISELPVHKGKLTAPGSSWLVKLAEQNPIIRIQQL